VDSALKDQIPTFEKGDHAAQEVGLANWSALLYYRGTHGEPQSTAALDEQVRGVYTLYRTFGGEDMSWEGARATVVEDAGQRVFVVLYDVPETDERALDRWDGATLDYYRKLRVRVETLDGDVLAWLYVLNAYEGGLPSARNLGLLADAAEMAGAPADYVAEIRARPCASTG